jgi:peptide/nickel transport system permease protein
MTKTTTQYSAKAEVSNLYVRRSFTEKAIINLKKAPITAWIGMIIVTFYFFVAIFAPFLAPYGEAQIFKVPYAPWDSVHIFGTDRLGRDIFSRLVYGARNTMGIALITTFLAFLIGVGLGLLSAILSGWVDQILARFVDILMAIPSLIFALMLLSIFGSTALNLILIIAVLDSTRVFRLSRAVGMNIVVMEYVEAAKLRGEKIGWIMSKEILPNILPPLVAEFGLRFCYVFLMIASLSFLGVGIQPPTADWGSMVRETAELIQFAAYDITAALTPILPAAAIGILTIGVNFVVDWFLYLTSGLKDEIK